MTKKKPAVKEAPVKEVVGAACPRCLNFVKNALKVVLCSRCGYYDNEIYTVVNGTIRSRKKLLQQSLKKLKNMAYQDDEVELKRREIEDKIHQIEAIENSK